MTFTEFQTLRESLLRSRRGVLDCAETNIYRALSRLAPSCPERIPSRVHRCHLAGEWCERFGFPAEMSGNALVSCGVRDSLARLFRNAAEKKALVWLPEDNYPTYLDLARAAGCEVRTFTTLPQPRWPSAAADYTREVLLVTNPIKPLGRHLDPADIAALNDWLSANPGRRLWLDTVYTFDTVLDAGSLELHRRGQTLLLHSLSKGWLLPRTFGVSLVPVQDVAELAPIFRADPPPMESLALARLCLGESRTVPTHVQQAVRAANAAMRTGLPKMQLPAPGGFSGYLQAIPGDWRHLLESCGILGLPASVFGSRCRDVTILSSLAFAA